MSWLKNELQRHVCSKPKIWPWTEMGARWQCDECKTIWQVGGPMHPRQNSKSWGRPIGPNDFPKVGT